MKEPPRVQEKWRSYASLDIAILYIQVAPFAKEFFRYPVCTVSVPTNRDGLWEPPRFFRVAPEDKVVFDPNPTPVRTIVPLFIRQIAHGRFGLNA